MSQKVPVTSLSGRGDKDKWGTKREASLRGFSSAPSSHGRLSELRHIWRKSFDLFRSFT